MPLTELQASLARLLSSNRGPDSYLAGGAAIHIEPNSKRFSNDLDYFNDSPERVAKAFEDDHATLTAAGYAVEVVLQQPGFVRALVSHQGDATRVDWAHDSAWRFLPVVESSACGFQLHPIDLAISKLLALVGRNEPRDFLDTLHVHRQTLALGALCWAAPGKDPGFTPHSLLELLRRRGTHRPEEFARLHLIEPVDLPALKTEWHAALDAAELFVDTRPPNEVGCLYYSPAKKLFVAPTQDDDEAVPHFGQPGGVWPRIIDG